MSRILELLAQKLEVDSLGPDEVLADYPEWDSLTVLAFLAAAHAEFGIVVESEEIARVRTAGDLERLIESKRRNHA
jgi:acyl carrier protein